MYVCAHVILFFFFFFGGGGGGGRGCGGGGGWVPCFTVAFSSTCRPESHYAFVLQPRSQTFTKLDLYFHFKLILNL